MALFVVLDDFASGAARLQAGAVIDDGLHDLPALVAAGLVAAPVTDASVSAAIQAYISQRGVGPRELDPYGSMLGALLGSNGGASFVRTLSGQSVEALLGGVVVPYAYILRPGDPNPANGVFTSWVDMMAAYAAAVTPPQTFFFDDSLAPIRVPAGAYTVAPSMNWLGWLFTVPATITFEDGATLNTIPFVRGGLVFVSESSVPVVTTLVDFAVLSYLEGNVALRADGTAPLYRVSAATVISASNSVTFLASASPVIEIASVGPFATCVLALGTNVTIEPGTLATAGAAELGAFIPFMQNNSNPDLSWDQPGYDSVAGPINAQLTQLQVPREPIQSVNADTDITATNYIRPGVYLVDSSAGPVTISISKALAFYPPFELVVKKTTGDANIVRVETTAPDTVEGAAGFDLTLLNQAVRLASDGVGNLSVIGGYLL